MISKSFFYKNIGISYYIKQEISYIGIMECHLALLMMRKNILVASKKYTSMSNNIYHEIFQMTWMEYI
jgi:hypothetical protein